MIASQQYVKRKEKDQHFSELSLGQSQRRKQAFFEVAYTPEAVGRKYGYFVSAL